MHGHMNIKLLTTFVRFVFM